MSKKNEARTYGNHKADGNKDAMTLYGLFHRLKDLDIHENLNIELIDRFGKHERSLWNAIFGAINKRFWAMAYTEITNKELVQVTGLSEKTIIEARNNLIYLGFIDFIKGNKKIKNQYHLNDLKEYRLNLIHNGRIEEIKYIANKKYAFQINGDTVEGIFRYTSKDNPDMSIEFDDRAVPTDLLLEKIERSKTEKTESD